jgi:hypothetical protein
MGYITPNIICVYNRLVVDFKINPKKTYLKIRGETLKFRESPKVYYYSPFTEK